ncbi:MAG: BON domain-containing protein [Tepidiformaceae bacterium]
MHAPHFLNFRRRKKSAIRRAAGRAPRPPVGSLLPIVAGVAGIATGAALAFVFDPGAGRRRRKVTFDRCVGATKRAGRRGRRLGRMLWSDTVGTALRAVHRLRRPLKLPADDLTLAHRVESMIFRDPTVPKGRLNINVEHGVVVLRGALDDAEQIRALEEATMRVPGVTRVENLLHMAGTVAPNKAEAVHAGWQEHQN